MYSSIFLIFSASLFSPLVTKRFFLSSSGITTQYKVGFESNFLIDANYLDFIKILENT